MRTVLDSIPDAYLVIAGSGEMMEELIELSKKLAIEASIKFTGHISAEKYQYYKAADVFVLPSKSSEAFPNVLLEASASELPSVVSDLQCVKAIVHEGFNGLLARIGDEIDFARKIVYLLQNEEVRREMGMNARKNCEAFSWDAVATETERLYLSLLHR
jgi:glycosyltransferase involved in cell wall biosynthesis